MSWRLLRRHRHRRVYWVVESSRTTVDVLPGRVAGTVTLVIRGPLTAVVLGHEGVSQRVMPQVHLHRLRFATGSGVLERLRAWAMDREDVNVSIGCVTDGRGALHPPSLSGIIADLEGNDIVFGDPDHLTAC